LLRVDLGQHPLDCAEIKGPRLGTFAIVEMVVFVAILLLGWLYALKKGALKWQ